MTCYIIHETTTNKHVLELSKLANEISRNKQYSIPDFVWVHYDDCRLFNNYLFPLLRTRLVADHSKSEIYSDTNSYYDTTKKKKDLKCIIFIMKYLRAVFNIKQMTQTDIRWQ